MVWCGAGDGSFGQLGNGAGNFTRGSFNSSVPVEVLGNHSFESVCAGQEYSCALEAAGSVWCWGRECRCGPGLGKVPRKGARLSGMLGSSDGVHSTTANLLRACRTAALQAPPMVREAAPP